MANNKRIRATAQAPEAKVRINRPPPRRRKAGPAEPSKPVKVPPDRFEPPATFNGDLENLPPALQPLTEECRWVIWRWELRRAKKTGKLILKNGKPQSTKEPFSAE